MNESDKKFLVHLIAEICNYAIKNHMKPDDTLLSVANWIISMCEVSTFNGWKAVKGNGKNN